MLEYKTPLSLTNATEDELPSFAQFLEYIIHTRHHDMHWMSYSKKCLPCQFKYHAFIKLENGEKDVQYVLNQSGLEKFGNYRKTHVTKGGSSTNLEIKKKYFGSVPCDVLKRVFKYYKNDFLLFNYNPNEHYQLCFIEES